MLKETSSPSVQSATSYPSTVIIAGNRYEVCPCCGLPKARKSALRRLDKLTARLLRQAGYRIVAWRRAWLYETQAQVETRHGQGNLFGDEVEASRKTVGRLSFFKRIQVAKGSPAAQWEDVFFCELREPGGGESTEVLSPPYTGNEKHDSTHDQRDARRLGEDFQGRGRGSFRGSETYGESPENLGNLPDRELNACNTGALDAVSCLNPAYDFSGWTDTQVSLRWNELTPIPLSKLTAAERAERAALAPRMDRILHPERKGRRK